MILAGRVGPSRLEKRLDSLIRLGLLAIFFLAPLPFGSVEIWAFSALELGVAAVGLLWLYRLFLFPATPVIGSPLILPPLLLLVVMGLQLVPLPPRLLRLVSPATAALYERTVPGYSAGTRDLAAAEATLAGDAPPAAAIWLPVSQAPHATRTYLLKGIAFTLFFFLFLNAFQRFGSIRWLLYAFVAAGALQAFYGLIEYLSGHQHIFAYEKKHYTDAATGTFINRNHFAAFLEMALLVALGFLFSKLREPHIARSWRERVLALAGRQASLGLALLLSIGIILVGLVLSYSRAGIAIGLGMAGILCLVQLSRGWSARKIAAVALLAGAVLVPAYGVGYWRLTGRYAILTQEFANPGGRLAVWVQTVRIFRDFPALGTGVGTFQYVFPRYREATTTLFYDYAHNDYLQLLSEAGISGALALLWGVYLIGRLLLRGSSGPEGMGVHRLAVGLALLAIGLHEIVDFGLQIPGNLLALTFLAGCLALLARADTASATGGEPADA